jgi:outer membrane protein assembly factor BamB
MSEANQIKPVGAVPENADQAACRAWRMGAWIGGAFSLLVGVALLLGHFNAKADDPLHSPRLKEYKEKLRLSPADETLKQSIRQLDWQLRQQYSRQSSRLASGTYLLFGGIAACVFAIRRVARYQAQLPHPQPKGEAASRTLRDSLLSRWSVAASGAAVGALLFLLSLGLSTALPKRPVDVEKILNPATATAAAATATTAGPASGPGDFASLDELKHNWPCFRGICGGVTVFTNLPEAWTVQSGAGLAWKVPAPASGFGSTIVWGGRVFFSGGDAAKREVFCLDGNTGQILWRQPVADVPGSPGKRAEVPDSTGYAAATMASDGRRLYVVFANGDVAAFTFEGKLVWSKSFGPLKNPYGHASSPATWQDRLILQLDQGDNEEGKSKVYALDGRTGQVVWQQARKVGSSWSSPIVFEAGGKPQVVLQAVPWVISYSAVDGAELWRVECLNGEITPSPVFAGGLVFVASPSDRLLAIRPDGQGDVTKTHVSWTNEDNVPDITSPVSNGELVFTLTSSGMLTCYDAKDGKKQWEHDFETECHASPSLAGNRLYVFGQKGGAFIVEAARQFKEIFSTQMGDAFDASPAFAQDRIYLRGVTNIYCLGTVKK